VHASMADSSAHYLRTALWAAFQHSLQTHIDPFIGDLAVVRHTEPRYELSLAYKGVGLCMKLTQNATESLQVQIKTTTPWGNDESRTYDCEHTPEEINENNTFNTSLFDLKQIPMLMAFAHLVNEGYDWFCNGYFREHWHYVRFIVFKGPTGRNTTLHCCIKFSTHDPSALLHVCYFERVRFGITLEPTQLTPQLPMANARGFVDFLRGELETFWPSWQWFDLRGFGVSVSELKRNRVFLDDLPELS
jgi:hypothetical protein